MSKQKRERKVCEWKYDWSYDFYDTECGQGQYFETGDVKENHYEFCPYCGLRIKEEK